MKAGCLEVATRLGDLLDDLVIVGGLVPALLVDLAQEETSDETDPLSRHVGTRDLDLGFAIGLVDEGRYTRISTRLVRCGFAPDRNEEGNPTPQRWRHETASELTVDFLISPTGEEEGGSIKHLEGDLAAIVIPGLEVAFEDLRRLELTGTRLSGAEATQEVPVCGPGAFVLLKALACARRGKDKDKYDLFYMIRNYGEGPPTVAGHFRPFLESGRREAEEAREILGDLFESPLSIGPVAVSQLSDDALQADAAAFVEAFLRQLES
ncbi:hypothetical protein BSZ35_18295 [Salinibacter sp. 10B]|uniref:hypothetical protein n=1 Tax=Salinibacter sp. 10B TaxID=1923971 RepID=UPI000CF46996|nr:hypothetical protein [Salinibacter sp. 10B]PQJ26880.1 hypothetical protein BSZ35_18295 [Salinibacter sp. 10B]